MDFLEINLSDSGYALSYGLPRASYVSTEDFSLILSIDRNEAYQPHEVYGLSKVLCIFFCIFSFVVLLLYITCSVVLFLLFTSLFVEYLIGKF